MDTVAVNCNFCSHFFLCSFSSFIGIHNKVKHDMQDMYIVTLRHICLPIIAMEKS